MVDALVECVVVLRWASPLLLATSETHWPMPCVWAAEAEALQLLTADVTASPWLVVELDDEVVVSADSVPDSSDDEFELWLEFTVSTVWLWWLEVGFEVNATAPPAPAVTATTATPAAALEVTRLTSLARSKVRSSFGGRSGVRASVPAAPWCDNAEVGPSLRAGLIRDSRDGMTGCSGTVRSEACYPLPAEATGGGITRSRPSCTTVTASRPSAVKMLPRDRVRAP